MTEPRPIGAPTPTELEVLGHIRTILGAMLPGWRLALDVESPGGFRATVTRNAATRQTEAVINGGRWNAEAADPAPDEVLYVITEGMPGPDSGRFVELETADGRSVGEACGAGWTPYPGGRGLYRLGPFIAAAKEV